MHSQVKKWLKFKPVGFNQVYPVFLSEFKIKLVKQILNLSQDRFIKSLNHATKLINFQQLTEKYRGSVRTVLSVCENKFTAEFTSPVTSKFQKLLVKISYLCLTFSLKICSIIKI